MKRILSLVFVFLTVIGCSFSTACVGKTFKFSTRELNNNLQCVEIIYIDYSSEIPVVNTLLTLSDKQKTEFVKKLVKITFERTANSALNSGYAIRFIQEQTCIYFCQNRIYYTNKKGELIPPYYYIKQNQKYEDLIYEYVYIAINQ